MNIIMAMVVYSGSFLFSDPIFKINGKIVTEDEWCENNNNKPYNYDEVNFLYPGWTKEFELICKNQKY